MEHNTNSSSNESGSTKLMGLLDDHKEHIPEGLYLQMCTALAALNAEEQSKEGIFKVFYIYSTACPECPDHEGRTFFNMHLKCASELLKIPLLEAIQIEKHLERHGSCEPDRYGHLTQLAHDSEIGQLRGNHCDDCSACERNVNVVVVSYCRIVKLQRVYL